MSSISHTNHDRRALPLPEPRFERIISGQAGLWASPIRVALRGAELIYSELIKWRNRRFDSPGASTRVSVPVIGVGNVTVGGTGKTPLVIEIVRRMTEMGLKPAVVARGYGAKQGEPNDEEVLIRKHHRKVIYVSDSDRVRGAKAAIQRDDANVILLDDGFQHRRLGRDLDIVVIDATCPFGYEHVLPRGLLREPLTGLDRADVLVISRCDQVDQEALNDIQSRLRQLAPRATQLRANHRIVGVDRMDGTVVAGALDGGLRGKRAAVFAAIGRPRSFLRTVDSLGVHVVGTRWWPDHHAYYQGDIHDVVAPGRLPVFDVILTTEKDAVKLAPVPGFDPSLIFVVKVAIDFLGGDGKVLDELLKKTVARSMPRDSQV